MEQTIRRLLMLALLVGLVVVSLTALRRGASRSGSGGDSHSDLGPLDAHDGTRTIVTLADYFELGEHRVAAALTDDSGSHARISSALVERAARAVVRVRAHHDFRANSYSTTHATGVLLMGGRFVVTVAHELAVVRQAKDARLEILLTDGRAFTGRSRSFDHYDEARPETDWAWLEVVDAPGDLPYLDCGDPSPGPRLVLGYPGRYGRDEHDRIALDNAARNLALRPLRALCATLERDSTQLELVAGCVPLGGMSGAPCIDARGYVVALQRGVTDELQGARVSPTLSIVGLEAFRAAALHASAGK